MFSNISKFKIPKDSNFRVGDVKKKKIAKNHMLIFDHG